MDTNISNVRIVFWNNGTNSTEYQTLLDYEFSIAFILTVLTLLSSVTNITITVVFFKYKCLRTIYDMLVINLAFTNLIITLGISFFASYTLNPGGALHMKLICLNLFVFIFGGILASLLVLLCLSLERYICIVHPFTHHRIKTRHVVLFSILAYVLSITYTSVPFILKNNWNRHQICVADVFPFDFGIAEQIVGLLIIIAIIPINIIVFKTARGQAAAIKTLLKSVNPAKSRRLYKRKGRAFMAVFLLSGVSIVCWVPLFVVFGIESNPELDENLRWIFTQLLYIPVALNSFITGIIIGNSNKHFRNAVKSMLCKRQHHCNRSVSIF